MYGEVPPVTPRVMEPEELPSQRTSVLVTLTVIGTPESTKFTEAIPSQPLSFVTVSVYKPCFKFVIDVVFAPLLQR